MQNQSNNFIALSEVAVQDKTMRSAVVFGTGNASTRRLASMYAAGEAHGEGLRQQGAEAKRRALRKLPELLELAESNLTANGVTVLWASDAAEANAHVRDIAKKHGLKKAIKVKSMLSEEIGLNGALESAGIEVVETDLGEWIVQLSGDHPSHVIAPIIHKTKASIRDLFVERFGMTPTDDAAEMVAFAREKLRAEFLSADMGISGGNFIIAESGTLCLVTNEGNGRLCTSLPDVHVAVVGIEKIVETFEDYATLTQTLTRSGTGQLLTVYTQMINGPRRPNEMDGPRQVYVILVDNGRSDIYATEYAAVLACVRCGACQNVCPVYRSTGGHAYGWVYGGPIGAVLTPLLTGIENASPLPYASSLCGACKAACPVDIDLPKMLLDLRRDVVEHGKNGRIWDVGIKVWALGNRSQTLFKLGGIAARLGQKVIGQRLPEPLAGWTKYRDFPEFAPKSFHQRWAERKKGTS